MVIRQRHDTGTLRKKSNGHEVGVGGGLMGRQLGGGNASFWPGMGLTWFCPYSPLRTPEISVLPLQKNVKNSILNFSSTTPNTSSLVFHSIFSYIDSVSPQFWMHVTFRAKSEGPWRIFRLLALHHCPRRRSTWPPRLRSGTKNKTAARKLKRIASYPFLPTVNLTLATWKGCMTVQLLRFWPPIKFPLRILSNNMIRILTYHPLAHII